MNHPPQCVQSWQTTKVSIIESCPDLALHHIERRLLSNYLTYKRLNFEVSSAYIFPAGHFTIIKYWFVFPSWQGICNSLSLKTRTYFYVVHDSSTMRLDVCDDIVHFVCVIHFFDSTGLCLDCFCIVADFFWGIA